MKSLFRKTSCILAFTALCGGALSSDETKIDRDLRELLNVSSGGDVVEVALQLERQADIPALLASLKARSASGGERHAAVIRALGEVASAAQPAVLSALERLRREGKVDAVKPDRKSVV